ncbi:MAG: hypothetical protein RL122_1959 [Pseudomonadota bacterium]|jgi:hypothetical protein|uniref:Carbohydrate porin n=1 Tax=Thiothrix fructosivorans TaxID=111770 RepID=A0A8B0SN82_9GAMM|nr:carbohydrate porin [Thiothrix fructosivorans]MBO0614012.1 carbohydrate porin [Thiothrix fructosivorans]QTX10372.1 carbohydrate porin [Thiothrix fructosivorans]
MKMSIRLSVISGIAMLSLSVGAMAADAAASPKTFTFGGDVELDITADDGGDAGNNFTHGGRIKLNAVGETKGDNYFIKGVAQPLVPFKGSSLGYDDVFLQMGRDKWDVQIGRFEAANLFPLGKDTIVSHAGAGEAKVYEANKARGRKDDVLHVALHSNPSDKLKLELGVMNGKADSDSFTALRPAVSYNMGNTTLHAGFETVKDKATDGTELKQSGVGVGAGVKLGATNVNASVASLSEKATGKADVDVTSLGLNMQRGPFGAGLVNSTTDNGSATKPKVNTVYATYTVPVFGSKDASVTFAANASRASNVAKDESVNAVRVRFNYGF